MNGRPPRYIRNGTSPDTLQHRVLKECRPLSLAPTRSIAEDHVVAEQAHGGFDPEPDEHCARRRSLERSRCSSPRVERTPWIRQPPATRFTPYCRAAASRPGCRSARTRRTGGASSGPDARASPEHRARFRAHRLHGFVGGEPREGDRAPRHDLRESADHHLAVRLQHNGGHGAVGGQIETGVEPSIGFEADRAVTSDVCAPPIGNHATTVVKSPPIRILPSRLHGHRAHDAVGIAVKQRIDRAIRFRGAPRAWPRRRRSA